MSKNEYMTRFLQAADRSSEDMQTNRGCDDDIIPSQDRDDTVTLFCLHYGKRTSAGNRCEAWVGVL